MFEDYNEPDYLTEDDPLTALLAQPTNEEKRKRKELEEQESNSKKLQALFYENQLKQQKYLDSQSQRENDLRVIQGLQPDASGKKRDLKTRTDEKYAENIKSHYGFTPDSKKKKTLAGILEAVTGVAGTLAFPVAALGYGQNKNRARNDANYELNSEFNRLIGTERLESQNFKDQSNAAQRNISELQKGALGYGQQDIQKMKLEQDKALKTRQMDIQEKFKQQELELKETLQGFQALQMEAKTGNIEAQTAAERFKLEVAQKVGMDPRMISDANLPVLLEKIYKGDATDGILKNIGVIADTKNASKAKFAPAPKPQLRTSTSTTYNPDGTIASEDIIPHWFSPGGGGGGGSQGASGSAPLSKGIGSKASVGDNFDAEKYKNVSEQDLMNEIKTKPAAKFTTTNKKIGEEYSKKAKSWEDLDKRETTITTNLLKLHSEGKLEGIKGFFQGSDMGKAVRGALGMTTPEESAINQNEIINLLEHIRTRFGGRPAVQTFETIHNAITNKADSGKSALNRELSMYMMINGMNKVTRDGRLAVMLDKIKESHQANPEGRITMEQAINQEIEDAISYSKQGKGFRLPSFENALQRAMQPVVKAKDRRKMIGPQE